METLDGTDWDIVVAGTGLAQSLLALSLSRSGKRILHLDKNDYYGGDEAAFSLSEAEAWAAKHSAQHNQSTFSDASIKSTRDDAQPNAPSKLASSRAYSLTLSPQLLYSKSKLVSAVVSSHIHNQLDFQAVGSWFVLHPHPPSFSLTRLLRVPSGREDVFSDTTLDLRAKRALMKFLRFVSNYEEQTEVWEEDKQTAFPTFLERRFGLPPASHPPILALTMCEQSPASTSTETALPRIAQHLRSLGVFGAGFAAVLPKWGGMAEIVQVACRACAVGGGVYVLNKAVKSMSKETVESSEQRLQLELDNGEKVTAVWLVGSGFDLPESARAAPLEAGAASRTSRSISIVSSPLGSLFPRTAEGGPIPAGAVVMVPSSDDNEPPVYVLAHTSEAGECPMNQSVLYASAALPPDQGYPRLQQAVTALLESVDERDMNGHRTTPEVLWSLNYGHTSDSTDLSVSEDGIVVLPPMPLNLVFDDSLLENVKMVWQKTSGESDDRFMQFEAREGVDMSDE